jgi:hypothetical protein
MQLNSFPDFPINRRQSSFPLSIRAKYSVSNLVPSHLLPAACLVAEYLSLVVEYLSLVVEYLAAV